MNLFQMSEADIDRAAEAHYQRLYDIYYGTDEPEPCCKICHYHGGSDCRLCEWDDSVPDYKTVDDDDCCDRFRKCEEVFE